MAAYRRVYDSRHLQADCQEPRSAPEPYARQSSMGYLYLFTACMCVFVSFIGNIPYSMRSSVYVTVRCPSVYLSQHGPTAATAAGLLLWAQRAGNIDQLLHGRRSVAAAWGGRMRAVPRRQRT